MMLKEFQKHIQNHFPFLQNSKLLLAVSGGIDSVVLAHLTHQLKFNFSICHCNFQLRGEESNKDEIFVMKLSNDLSVNIFTTRFNTQQFAEENKLSVQVAARDLRYQWFYELIDEHDFDYVLTAHNSNDNLETFLINLTRGTGLEGLTGIPPINDKSVRPLLKFSRDNITSFATKNSISWREDQSNTSVKYIRNKIRHQVFPVLQEINPNVLESFQKTIDHLNESQAIIDDKIDEVQKEITKKDFSTPLRQARRDTLEMTTFDIEKIQKLSNPKAYLYEVLKGFGFTEWNDVVDLLAAQSGKQLFSKTHRLVKDRNFLFLTDKNNDLSENNSFKIGKGENKITEPIELIIEGTDQKKSKNQNEIIVDKDLLKFPLQLRKWKHGDYICPTGMTGSKKLSQLFKDKKLSLVDKENIWLLTDAKDTIIWVIGLRQDRRFSVYNKSTNILKISTPSTKRG